ncbi:MAG: hypothetical protein D6766_01000 [Verrucomicrobia bacterium]|nr:MAG: hypothetical protein D6766_01000 [Verrucomicrobiota bacterium]
MGFRESHPRTMKEIELLKELQDIEFLARKTAEEKARAAELRQIIPAPILGHYDRLAARGKKGVALVQRTPTGGVCGGCRMRLATGAYARLLRGDDIAMCDNCARYLLLAPEEPPPPAPRSKARRKGAARAAA